MTLIYKLLDRAAWEAALAEGVFKGSDLDLADGFIHFSSGGQAVETARRHFSGRDNLVLVAVDADALGATLRWEPSRGGDLFPHLYAPLPVSAAVFTRVLARGPDGAPDLGELA